MFAAPIRVEATRLTRLPERMHYTGTPTAWTRMTRPGLALHSFLEGVIVGDTGELFVSDVPHGRIFRIAPPDAQWTEIFTYDGEPHGLALLPGRRLLIADYSKGLLALDLATSTLTTVCSGHNSENFRGLSDLVVDADGFVWFTDSGRTSLTDPTGRLFRLAPDGALRCVLANVPYPNGVAIGADGASVFVAATRGNAVWKLARALPASGTPMAGIHVQLSGGLGPDGLAVSPAGALAIAHAQAGCAWVFDALGQPLLRIDTPGGLWTTSVRFAPDGERLYIVDAQTGSIYYHSFTA